jgi:glucose/arabinose dehydrogenase
MRKYLAPAAAALGTLAAIVITILLLTTPWSAGSSQGSAIMQGDTDCDLDVDAVDAFFGLKWIAAIEPYGDCTEVAFDTDCSGELQSTDALHILRLLAALPSLVPPGCTPIGEFLPGEPTPTPSQSSTPALTPTPTPGGSLTPTGTPTPEPTPTPTLTPGPSACAGPASQPQSEPGGLPAGAPSPNSYALMQVIPAATFERMIDMALLPGSGDREAVVITQHGLLYRVCIDGPGTALPFGDVSDLVNCCGEQGLLSIAFSPNYTVDHYVYLYYTQDDNPGNNCPNLSRCSVTGRFTVANNQMSAQPANIVLKVDQPASNHNGGKLLFDGEGLLYLSLGDGGGQNDQFENGQNINALLGKILRIDVSGGGPGYESPGDNPFVGTDGRDEIFAWGFRNPWRMSFDSDTGDLWVGDVGQGSWEEVNFVEIGRNYGWNCYEGFQSFDDTDCGPMSEYEFPRAVYDHSDGNQAIAGGYVYHGSTLPELEDWFVYTDTYSGRIWAVDTQSSADPVLLADEDVFAVSFFEMPNGELLLVTQMDAVYQLVAD